jgi:pectate lyase
MGSLRSIVTGAILLGILLSPAAKAFAQPIVPSFPGAEGYGAITRGGRGGRVIEVTNLNDSGAGSLRECATASGPRICVFRIGGTITLNSDIDITQPYLTIAGQTAPGGGITLKAASSRSTVHVQIRTYEVIIRYIRSRPGTRMFNSRALSMNNGANSMATAARNIMIDHNSFSWSGDELTIAWLFTNTISYQWNIAAESLPPLDESSPDTGIKGPSFGETGGGYFSVHHNLLAHHTQRSPQVSASVGTVDIVNNVIYNPGGLGSVSKNGTHVNYVKNYIKAGPNSRLRYYVNDEGNGAKGPADAIYLQDNYLDGVPGIINSTANVVPSRLNAPPIIEGTPQGAYADVLQKAGASAAIDCNGSWYPRRDAVDTRILQSVADRTRGHLLPASNTYQQLGYIASPADVGGWPNVLPGTPCADTDHDGMGDAWEQQQFGSITRGSAASSAGDYDNDGYTDLEEYINGTDPKGTSSPTPTSAGRPGDANGDGLVNGTDYFIWLTHYGTAVSTGPAGGDFNRDGSVTGTDYSIWVSNYG